MKLRVFWSKQRKSIWFSAWNLAFSVFISPIKYQYESVNFKELHKSHTKAKHTIDRKKKRKRKRDIVMSTTLNTSIYNYKNQHRGTCLPIVFVSLFIWNFLFFCIDENDMFRTFPLYQLYLQILRHHRHKRPQTQLQQVSDCLLYTSDAADE